MSRPVVPLQLTKEFPHLGAKIGLTQHTSSLFLQDKFLMDTLASDSNYFLTEMKECFAKLLKQNNTENLYDKIILMFRSWQQAHTFLQWVNLSGHQVREGFKNFSVVRKWTSRICF